MLNYFSPVVTDQELRGNKAILSSTLLRLDDISSFGCDSSHDKEKDPWVDVPVVAGANQVGVYCCLQKQI